MRKLCQLQKQFYKNYNIPALRKNDLNIPDDILCTLIIKSD